MYLLLSVPQDNNWKSKLVSCLIDYNLLEIERTIAQGLSIAMYLHACILRLSFMHLPHSV